MAELPRLFPLLLLPSQQVTPDLYTGKRTAAAAAGGGGGSSQYKTIAQQHSTAQHEEADRCLANALLTPTADVLPPELHCVDKGTGPTQRMLQQHSCVPATPLRGVTCLHIIKTWAATHTQSLYRLIVLKVLSFATVFTYCAVFFCCGMCCAVLLLVGLLAERQQGCACCPPACCTVHAGKRSTALIWPPQALSGSLNSLEVAPLGYFIVRSVWAPAVLVGDLLQAGVLCLHIFHAGLQLARRQNWQRSGLLAFQVVRETGRFRCWLCG